MPVSIGIAEARELVQPENLEDVLRSLVTWQVILRFELTAQKVLIWEKKKKRLEAFFEINDAAERQISHPARPRKLEE